MKNRIAYTLGAGLVAAGLLAAQAPQANTGRPARGARWAQAQGANQVGQLGRMARLLNLTDSQKEQARAIFKSAAERSQPVAAQMRDARQKLQAAAKANAAQAEINQLAQVVGGLQGQLAANRAQAFAQFYQILTPEQKLKLDTAQELMKNRAQRMRRGGQGAGLGRAQQQ